MTIEDLFVTEVLRWRYAGTLFTVLLVQALLPLLFCSLFRTVFVLQVWSPLSMLQLAWASPWLLSLFWPSVCLLLLTRLHVHNYTVSGQHHVRVWHVARALLRVRVLLVGGAACACVCALTQHYAAAAHPDFASVVRPCHTSTGSQVCVNSRMLVSLVFGAYFGLLHAANYCLGNGNLVTMATVTVPKRQRLRALLSPRQLVRKLVGAVWGSGGNGEGSRLVGVRGVLGVVVLYALLGGLLEQWVARVVGAPVLGNSPSSSVLLDSSGAPHQHLLNAVEAITATSFSHAPGNEENSTDSAADGLLLSATGGADAAVNKTEVSTAAWVLQLSRYQRLQVLTDPVLLLVLLLTLALLTVMLDLFYQIFAIFVMQPISLPVTAHGGPDGPVLPWVMGEGLQSSHPLLRLLANQCLATLGGRGGPGGEAARKEVFTISQPGGHPRNWNTILTPTLALIRDFTQQLMKQNCPEEYAAQQATAAAGESTAGNISLLGTQGGNTSLLSSANGNTSMIGTQAGNTSIMGTSVGNASMIAAHGGNASMLGGAGGNMSTIRNATMLGHNTTLISGGGGGAEDKKGATRLTTLRCRVVAMVTERGAVVRRLPVVRWLLAELPDAANKQIFAQAQTLVWALQGLCGLVTASFTEDRYGLVQRNMGDILTALLQLNMMLDKTGRPPLPTRVPPGGGGGSGSAYGGGVGVVGDGAPYHARLRRAVKLVLRTQLYRVTDTFGGTIHDVPLPPHLKSKVQSYLERMEG